LRIDFRFRGTGDLALAFEDAVFADLSTLEPANEDFLFRLFTEAGMLPDQPLFGSLSQIGHGFDAKVVSQDAYPFRSKSGNAQ